MCVAPKDRASQFKEFASSKLSPKSHSHSYILTIVVLITIYIIQGTHPLYKSSELKILIKIHKVIRLTSKVLY